LLLLFDKVFKILFNFSHILSSLSFLLQKYLAISAVINAINVYAKVAIKKVSSKAANVTINRKMLAEMAANDMTGFKALVEKVQK